MEKRIKHAAISHVLPLAHHPSLVIPALTLALTLSLSSVCPFSFRALTHPVLSCQSSCCCCHGCHGYELLRCFMACLCCGGNTLRKRLSCKSTGTEVWSMEAGKCFFHFSLHSWLGLSVERYTIPRVCSEVVASTLLVELVRYIGSLSL